MATSFHVRSNSLPSKPHPLDDNISRLRHSQATSTSSSSIGNNLVALQDLYDCVDRLLPLVQQHNRTQVDKALEGSLEVLDLCSTINEALLQTKDCVHQLQSAIRTRQDGLDNEIKKYISSRKMMNKTIRKVLKNVENRVSPSATEMLTMIKESQSITCALFESILSFVCEWKSRKPTGRSLVSTLMHQKRAASEESRMNTSEIAMVDAALESLMGCKTTKSDHDVEDVQNKLQSLELCIQDFEEGIECLFRKIIKTRVSFLNIFN